MDAEPDTAERDEATASLATARQQEMDARLSLRTAEERHRALYGKAEELRRAGTRRARGPGAGAAGAGGAGARRRRRAGRRRGGELALERIAQSLQAAAQERDTVQAERYDRERVLHRGPQPGARAVHRAGEADRRRAPRRGAARRAADAPRAARDQDRGELRHRPRRPGRRVRPGRAGAAEPGRDGRVRGGQGGAATGQRAAAHARTTGPRRSGGRSGPSGT